MWLVFDTVDAQSLVLLMIQVSLDKRVVTLYRTGMAV